jgi:hypothetical protein
MKLVGLRMFENRVDLTRRQEQEGGENCILRSYIIFTPQQIFLE